MKDKRLDELYQYIEEHEEKWKIDHLKRYEYEDRINKVIEYIKHYFCNNYDINNCWHSDIKKILDILKGVDK